MIKGITVTVLSPSSTSNDRFGNPVVTTTKKTVDNVLVSPGATSDLEASRPDGVTVALTLHFPKTFSGSLEGCLVELPSPWSDTYRVVGSPYPYIDANTPTPWNMTVEVEASHG